jgi:subtilisin family serine protease
VPPSKGATVIAVVDSGLAPEEDLPDWMRRPSVEYDRPQDTDVLTQKHPVSHGTFVTSVIRRIAPEHVVSMASARPDPGYMTTAEDPHLPAAPQPTDELNVFGAIVRLAERHQRDEVAALNLSLGAHDCPQDGGVFLLSMRIALDYWRGNFDGCEIFAAGGNSLCEEEVYPAAWDDVRAVGAADDGGRPLVWVNGNDETDLGRNWITDWAPGHDIQGLGGQSPEHVVEWSGSSFACAVATACFAIHADREEVGGQTFWTDQNVTYGSVPNLLI